MKKLLILILTMFVFAPAIAEPAVSEHIVDENTMCNIDGIGVNSGTARMEAIWTILRYSEDPGKYLSFDAQNDVITQHVNCPANSYCPGFTDQEFTDSNMGLESCSSISNGAYPYSATGTTTSDKCYNLGSVSCANRNPLSVANGSVTYANATALTKVYSGYGTILDNSLDCSATVSCDTGYTASEKGELADYVNVHTFYDEEHIRFKSNSGTETYGNNADSLSNGQWEFTFPDGTKVSGIASCNTTSGDESNLWGSDNPLHENTYNIIDANLRPNGTFTNSVSGTSCWCNMTGYTLNGSQNSVNTSANTRWVLRHTHDTVEGCANVCALDCVATLKSDAGFKKAVFDSYGNYPTCESNIITIEWMNMGQLHEENQCVYGDFVTLPSEPEARRGYTFGGWRVAEEDDDETEGQ